MTEFDVETADDAFLKDKRPSDFIAPMGGTYGERCEVSIPTPYGHAELVAGYTADEWFGHVLWGYIEDLHCDSAWRSSLPSDVVAETERFAESGVSGSDMYPDLSESARDAIGDAAMDWEWTDGGLRDEVRADHIECLKIWFEEQSEAA